MIYIVQFDKILLVMWVDETNLPRGNICHQNITIYNILYSLDVNIIYRSNIVPEFFISLRYKSANNYKSYFKNFYMYTIHYLLLSNIYSIA